MSSSTQMWRSCRPRPRRKPIFSVCLKKYLSEALFFRGSPFNSRNGALRPMGEKYYESFSWQ